MPRWRGAGHPASDAPIGDVSAGVEPLTTGERSSNSFVAPLGTVPVVKPSMQHRRDAEVLRHFREAYIALVNASEPHQPIFITRLRSGVPQDEWNRLRTELSLAAGRAEAAYQRHGGVFALRNAAYTMSGVSPVANWEMSLRDPDQLPPQTVISSVESAIGLAEARAADAEEREKGIVGLVAAFLRWPSTLREAVGPGHAVQRRAAGVLGVVAQLVVGVLASTLAAGLLALITLLWRSAG